MEDKILQAIEDLRNDSNRKFEALLTQVNSVAGQVNDLTSEVTTVAGQVNALTSQVTTVAGQVKALKGEVNDLSSQVNENTQILKVLEHLAQVNKAEHDKMTFELAGISSELKTMRKDLSTVQLMTANNWSDIVQLKSIK